MAFPLEPEGGIHIKEINKVSIPGAPKGKGTEDSKKLLQPKKPPKKVDDAESKEADYGIRGRGEGEAQPRDVAARKNSIINAQEGESGDDSGGKKWGRLPVGNKKVKPKKEKKQAKAPVSKESTDIYILKKNRKMKLLRLLFWGMLTFIFIKGVVVSLRPDPVKDVADTIASFKTEFSSYSDQDNEVLSFAQNFAKEFLTYEIKGEEDFVNRLRPYAAANVLNAPYKFSSGAEALYTQAYKKQAYTDNQMDVYVLANVQYTTKNITEDQTTVIDKSIVESTVLKIPVLVEDDHYIIEDMPVFVNDDIKISDYKQKDYSGKEVGKEESDAIKLALSNFYKAYYEEEQSVINYYLAQEADKSLFMGLNKRVLFGSIESLRCFSIEGSSDIMALVTVEIIDKNDVSMQQKFNLTLVHKDNQYYVKTMDARNVNLNASGGSVAAPEGGAPAPETAESES